jgi:hypothetical protein
VSLGTSRSLFIMLKVTTRAAQKLVGENPFDPSSPKMPSEIPLCLAHVLLKTQVHKWF